ncbi:MAG: aspartate aminotransferase family protein [Thaumarchaeota archaeon]|nr:aspartate aminotransferase family protein [Nitrososphaerota archaeon]
MDSREVMGVEDSHLAPVYKKFQVVLSKGSGSVVWDQNGREYIDCMAGYGVALVGHSNPHVRKAINQQLEKITTCHGSFYNEARSEALLALDRICPPNLRNYFLCNSGAETIEAALKLARRATGRKKLIAMTGSYHGKTMGALSTTWSRRYRDPFGPLLPQVEFVPFGNVGILREKVDETTAGVLLEPIQGESGIHSASEEFMLEARKSCDKVGSLLILDEIQTGLGRTGDMWAHQAYGVTPDILCSAKGLAGGLPAGAMITSQKVASSFRTGDHTTTVGGSPVVCAALKATLEFIEKENLVGRAKEMGGIFFDGLENLKAKHSAIREVRGKGLLIGLETRFDIRDILLSCMRRGLLLLYSGRNVLRFLPPLVIEPTQIKKALAILDKAFGEAEGNMGIG